MHGNDSYAQLKNFNREYATKGAYHLQAKGFKQWWLRDNYELIVSLVAGGDTILDVGCGEGALAGYLTTANFLYGLDISEEALNAMPDQYRLKYSKVCIGNMLCLDQFFSSDDKIDTVICSLALMYLLPTDVEIFLKKVNQLLMIGGKFIFSYPNVYPRVRACNPEAAELTWKELKKMLLKAGFNVQLRQGISGFIPNDLVKQSEVEEDNRIFNLYIIERGKVKHAPDYSYHYGVLCQKKTGGKRK